eukprot:CAMPEP_0206471218 /NCGR_PEP_ID=MMETSP0324_2-20121206/31418_1 /ASSEMBLY_ACC=CAM_ASM_000836 /TAXON_ID=2866 /ORGANISM="Crypthecodinium cohnii, Strain Seligo" /LENGTH=61 /DNA_ID=CAMNT_0053945473 /DNA_START=300 /DNA_END=482 /DNA_ORIENTATION=+
MQEKEDKERQEWKRKDVKILKDGLWWDCMGGGSRGDCEKGSARARAKNLRGSLEGKGGRDG